MLVSEPRLTWLEDPEVFAVNRKEAHSDHGLTCLFASL